MAETDGKKVSELTEITTINDTDLFYLARPSSETQGKVSFSKLKEQIGGGGGGASAYSGEDVPDNDFGSDGDIYFQVLNDFMMDAAGSYIWWTVSISKDNAGKYTLELSGTGYGSAVAEYVAYRIPNLVVGEEYTIKFNAQMSSDAQFYTGNTRTYGVIFTDNDDFDNYNDGLSAAGGVWDSINQYQSFYRDSNSHSYECTFTATATTMYFLVAFADVYDNRLCTLTISNIEMKLYINIKDIWTKKSGEWIKYKTDIEQNLYGAFIDTNRVITTLTGSGSGGTFQDYTAVDDCAVVGTIRGDSGAVQIDGATVAYTSDASETIGVCVYARRGQTVSYRMNSSSTLTIYGLTFGTQSIFTPIIYSTEEREVGVWIDNKPLYAKTIDCGALPNSASKAVQTLDDTWRVVGIGGIAISRNDPTSTRPLPFAADSTNAIRVDVSTKVLRLVTYSTGWTSYDGYVTLYYTKSTDVAGAGKYNTLGVPTVHYSTDEQVVGTWIDGSTIYSRVFDLGSDLAITCNEFTNTLIDASNMAKIIDAKGFYSAGTTVYNLMANINNNIIRLQGDRNGTYVNVRYVSLQYTKTS